MGCCCRACVCTHVCLYVYICVVQGPNGLLLLPRLCVHACVSIRVYLRCVRASWWVVDVINSVERPGWIQLRRSASSLAISRCVLPGSSDNHSQDAG